MKDEDDEEDEEGEAVEKVVMEEAWEESGRRSWPERDQTKPFPRRRLLRLALIGMRASVERLPAAEAVLDSDAGEVREEYFDGGAGVGREGGTPEPEGGGEEGNSVEHSSKKRESHSSEAASVSWRVISEYSSRGSFSEEGTGLSEEKLPSPTPATSSSSSSDSGSPLRSRRSST